MGDGMSVSITGDREFERELRHAIEAVTPEARKVLAKGALNVKKDWQQAWRGIRHAPRISRSISYDVTVNKASMYAVIGAEDGPVDQGFLAPIIEYGGIHNAPNPGGQPALDREEPRLVAAMEALSEELLP